MKTKEYVITIENPVTGKIEMRAVFERKAESKQAFKILLNKLKSKDEPLGLIMEMKIYKPNNNGEYIPTETYATARL